MFLANTIIYALQQYNYIDLNNYFLIYYIYAVNRLVYSVYINVLSLT